MDQNEKWFRLPIAVFSKEDHPGLEPHEVPKEQQFLTFIDVRADSIVGMRPYFGYDADADKPNGTIIYTTSGEDHVIEIMPSTMRKLLGYKPEEVKAETF